MSHALRNAISQLIFPHPLTLKNLACLEAKLEGEVIPIDSAVKPLFPKTPEGSIAQFVTGGKSKNPLKVGVVFSGGQAPGGHNVIYGLLEGIMKIHSDSSLIGFLEGPSGILKGEWTDLTREKVAPFHNEGGFDLIGSGRTKIETPEQLEQAAKTVQNLKLDGLVIIGGDDSNTNAAILAEYFLAKGIKTTVVGVPKTIDGDLKGEHIEISFGCDTACRTYASLIGNLCRDSLSAKKYTFFVKLMGRSASHIALECALQTHANYAFIGEEIAKKKKTFQQLVNELTEVVCKRAAKGKNYAVFLIPEGVIEFIPEFKTLIGELNTLLSKNDAEATIKQLSKESKKCFDSLPESIQNQLLLDRDPHGNVNVSKIETERLFLSAVETELKKRGDFKGKFAGQPHFLGYEGRSCYPSPFDAVYCLSLGNVAALLIRGGLTGYMASIQGLCQPVSKWIPRGVPIASMLTLETRKGKEKPVIKKAMVDLEGAPFDEFSKNREKWALDDVYEYPAPVQFFGSEEVIFQPPLTLKLERETACV